MEKFIALAVLVLASLACGQTVGSFENVPVPTHAEMPTLTAQALATKIKPLATPTPNIRVTVGSWHLRQQASATGESIIIPSGTTIEIIMTAGNWYLVQTVEEDPLDVVCGYIKADCCEVNSEN